MGDAKRTIVAVDFDGILCEDKFPEIGRPKYEMISFVREMQDAGVEVILWTSRIGDKLREAVEWCEDRGLHFTSVNTNSPSNLEEYKTDPRKIYADIYIDDHTPFYQHAVGLKNNADLILIDRTIEALQRRGVEI